MADKEAAKPVRDDTIFRFESRRDRFVRRYPKTDGR